ncbi:apolipoprotein d-like [Plakobranchus ocellatus]|uniref:Apolipoprotein d-like n=1 Tax=Plakobranchus ocellatus TaxID=259542 RepID=A0AAV4DPI5_9GAST|nr:apolipoprotein d-like [Plakobranchus ocellatus]
MDSVSLAKFVALMIVLFAGSVNGQFVIKEGKCPNVTGQATLEKAQYLGVWYEYERFPAIFEVDLDCNVATYGAFGKAISVTNNGTLRVDLFGRKVILKNSTANGLATVPNPDRPAEFIVAFGGVPTQPGSRSTVHDLHSDNSPNHGLKLSTYIL